MDETQRPGLVCLVIVTDGEENSSREYTKAQIKDMIQHQQDVYKWQFTFLGANQDAFAEAGDLGIPVIAAANYEPQKTAFAFAAAASNVKRMRKATLTGAALDNAYTDAERRAMTS